MKNNSFHVNETNTERPNLSSDDDSENLPMDDWIQDHKKKMLEASKLALSNTEKSAEQRNHQKNKKASVSFIPVGTRVLTRNRTLGRNKIQDTWCSTPYKVVKYLGDNVYSIQLADGSGPIKNVTRKEILDTGERVNSSDEYSSSEGSDLEYIPEQAVQIQEEEEHSPTAEDLEEAVIEKPCAPASSGEDSEEETVDVTQPRRSKRTTAGKHSNPFNLPKSTVPCNQISVQPSKFKELSDAIVNLGATLSATLSDSWARQNQM